MENEMPLAAMVFLVFLVQVGGCSLFRRPVDEAAALHEVHLELAAERADSDAALVLTQALTDAQELAPEHASVPALGVDVNNVWSSHNYLVCEQPDSLADA